MTSPASTSVIRNATTADLPAITRIYNAAVATTAIWNDVVVDEANRQEWLAARVEAGYPVLVAEVDGGAVGYATYAQWRAFDGYLHSVEHSVYVAESQRGSGVGTVLLTALIDTAREQGKHAMIAAIESGNTGSIRLHERLGFVLVGQMPQVGTKFGRWLDLTMLQLTLDARPTP